MIPAGRRLRFLCSSRARVIRDKSLPFALLLALSLFLAAGSGAEAAQKAPKTSKHARPHGKAAAPTFIPGLEPKAVDILKAASDRLTAARSMTFTAVVSYENPSRFGHPLVYTMKSEVTMQRPDKLRVVTPGDGPASEFYYDGKTMTAFSPAENLVAVAEAPPTMEAMLKMAYDVAATYFPFTDLLVADPYQAMAANGLKHAFYIGQSRTVGGTTTDMVAVIDDWVFQQIWIGAEDKLPRRARAVFLADPAHLRHDLELSNWQIDPVVPADAFTFSNTTGAKSIQFARPEAQPQPGAKPPAKPKAKPPGK
jgi:hypothetical protein